MLTPFFPKHEGIVDVATKLPSFGNELKPRNAYHGTVVARSWNWGCVAFSGISGQLSVVRADDF